MSDADLGKWNRKPYHRIQFVENCVWALNYIRDNGVALTNIGAEGPMCGELADDRYCGRKSEVDTWLNLDFDFTIHNSRYQVQRYHGMSNELARKD